MEKFYIVTKESNLNSAYWEYKNNIKEVNEFVKEFMSKESINANEYYVNAERIYIVPTKDDINKFNKILTKALDNGLRAFKLNSKVGKSWANFVKTNEIKFKYKPIVGTYFNAYGKSWSRLFNIGDTIYCSYESKFNFNNPKGFIEIKASEFYSAVENSK